MYVCLLFVLFYSNTELNTLSQPERLFFREAVHIHETNYNSNKNKNNNEINNDREN